MILMTIMKTVLTIKKVIIKMMIWRISTKTILISYWQLSNISISDQNVPNLKKIQTVSFSLNDENYIAEILCRAGKATDKYKNTFDVQYHHPSSKLWNSYVDFDKVKNIQKNYRRKTLNRRSMCNWWKLLSKC